MTRQVITVIRDAIGHFIKDDGAATASHVALNILMSLFPFMIFLTALASFFGTADLLEGVNNLLFEVWPESAAIAIQREITTLLEPRADVLTLGAVISFFLASNGVEALRVALNRAYRVTGTNNFLVNRLQSLFFVILGATGLLVLAFLIVLGPLLWRTALGYFPFLVEFEPIYVLFRFGFGIGALFVALIIVHLWLPAGRRRVVTILPGIGLTLCLWLAGGLGFAAYLENFSAYSATYAGLASIMIAIVFLYLVAVAFILGAELNAALTKHRWAPRQTKASADKPHAAGVADPG